MNLVHYYIYFGDNPVADLYIGYSQEDFFYSFQYAEDTCTRMGSLDNSQMRGKLATFTLPQELIACSDTRVWDPDVYHHQFNERHTRNGTGLVMVRMEQ